MMEKQKEIHSIMRSREFRWGVKDHRANTDSRANVWRGFSDLNYDRGQQWAEVAPRDMEWIIDGRLSPEAVAIYEKADII
jgi:hypothetical protein